MPSIDFYRLNYRAILVFSAAVLLLLTTVRLVNLFTFGQWADFSESPDLISAMLLRGLRFDLKLLATVLILIVWIPSLIPAKILPSWLSRHLIRYGLLACMLLVTFIAFIDIGYLSFYQVPIDLLFFGLFDDDTTAVFQTMLVNRKLLLLLALFLISAGMMTMFYLAKSRSSTAESKLSGWPEKLVLRVLLGLLLLVFARGSLDTFPLQRKSASVGDNAFINLLVMNSSFNLYYAWKDYQENTSGIFKQNLLKDNNLADYQSLLQRAGYSKSIPVVARSREQPETGSDPLHVVFVLMEGWSSQIALQHREDNPVLGALASHVREDYFFTHFLANTAATNSAVENLLLNSPLSPLSQSVARNTRFRLSNIEPFKLNNYRTTFISGGYASWRNHENFWVLQGFDRYIGRSEIENRYQVEEKDHPWGVYDEYLFRRLKEELIDAEQNGVTSFNFVLTTSNHSPMRFPPSYVRPPLQPKLYGLDPEQESSYELISGFHYASDQLGKFMDWLNHNELADKVLVVATGDHPLRTLAKTNDKAGQYLRYAVPVYIYSPVQADRLAEIPVDISASHSDLFPTIFELALPETDYYRFGESLMDKKSASAYGWNNKRKYIFADGFVDAASQSFYSWENDHHIMLNKQASQVSPDYLDHIERERFRKILKTYLLIQDYQTQIESAVNQQ